MPEREYLLFQLYGPVSSWGDIAVGEYRPSYERPSKSAVLGLLAAARGVKRPNTGADEIERQALDEIHSRMASDYGFAVESIALCAGQDAGEGRGRALPVLGSLLLDYHTIQRPAAPVIKKKGRQLYTRRDELAFANHELATTVSTRDYRQDGFYRVALWVTIGTPVFSLSRLAKDLHEPAFVLYLGRKSCAPALPLDPHLVRASGWQDAFDKAKFRDTRPLGIDFDTQPGSVARIRYGEEAEGEELQRVVRRDSPLSRRRWQFGERFEYQRVVRGEG